MADPSNNAGLPPNPNPNPSRYDLNAENRYFVCRRCRTPVIHPRDIYNLVRGDVSGMIGGDSFNVRAHHAIQRFFYDLPVNNLRCNECKNRIGVKFASDNENDPPLPRPYASDRFVFFYFDRLLFWTGDEFIDADTYELIKAMMSSIGTESPLNLDVATPEGSDDEGTSDDEIETEDEDETEISEETETDEDDSE